MLKKALKKILGKLAELFSGVFWYSRDLFKYKKLLHQIKASVRVSLFPQIFDKGAASHTFDKHYVYMDRWAFKQLLKGRPPEHVDVGSSIRFLSMASCVTRLKFVDIRPIKIDFDSFECIQGNILRLPFADSSVRSLSCLHVAEHIGLGRYGDPLDPQGTEKACKELCRVLAPGGSLYFALPIGRPVTYFNAHRVNSPGQILEYFKGLELCSFSAVGDDGRYYPDADWRKFADSTYACGMFIFKK